MSLMTQLCERTVWILLPMENENLPTQHHRVIRQVLYKECLVLVVVKPQYDTPIRIYSYQDLFFPDRPRYSILYNRYQEVLSLLPYGRFTMLSELQDSSNSLRTRIEELTECSLTAK
jgi:hypothetical protein